MKYDFNRIIDRRNTRSYKWDQSEKLFGDKEILPLWVADMDFASPPAVQEAILRRVQAGIYGYSVTGDSYKRRLPAGTADAMTGRFRRSGSRILREL